jgi:hypothetical protein
MTQPLRVRMTLTILTYIILLIIFLIISGLIFRHAIKFGYLAPRFRFVVGIFGLISLVVIIFSFYLLFVMGRDSSTSTYFDSGTTGATTIPSASPGDLNF